MIPWGPTRSLLLLALGFFACARDSRALGQTRYLQTTPSPGSFRIAQGPDLAPLFVDAGDAPGVIRAAGDLQADLARVTGRTPALTHQEQGLGARAILIGTIGKSRVLERLIRERKVDPAPISGKWEAFFLQVVADPWPGLQSALVIAGSDPRGTIYGIYDLSEQIGVSPWYWWADVPVAHRDALYVQPGRFVQGPPAVKYRGIFLNDEAPALSGWTKEKFGGFNHQFYEKVFELLLRLKANYLWPAMWASAFNEDDPLNPRLADEYGIVMGTSHHEPMLRAQQEWKRHGTGPWDYNTNAAELRAFWDFGVQRSKNYESIITIGMRGDGDRPMAPGGDMAANVALLEKIVAAQRTIIAQRMNPDPAQVPQLWALYKEVQDYYEHGMRVPDDVTLLWSDDNWGNLRRLPTAGERQRSGGAGIYYHFDYVGGPRSYKWLNTVPITKVWEQMNLAYHYGADRIWIVNVGDLKPLEFPIEFFLSMARDPERWSKDQLLEFTRLWAAREFGPAEANGIADIISKYTKYNGWRKPELLEPDTFSLENYQEADRVLNGWQSLTRQAEQIYAHLPHNEKDAFFELVLYPVKASAQVTELYIAAGKNRRYAAAEWAGANDLAAKVRSLFQADADLSAQYNHQLAGGKWNHMMDQTHIGYTTWQEPPVNTMPPITEIELPQEAKIGVVPEGLLRQLTAPSFDSYSNPRRSIEIFNRGRAAVQFSAEADAPWIVLSQTGGRVEKEDRLWVSVDWTKAPLGMDYGEVFVRGPDGKPVTIRFKALHGRGAAHGFVESAGSVSIEAEHYSRKTEAGGAHWDRIPDCGRTLSCMTVFPVTSPSLEPPAAPSLEYPVYLLEAGAPYVHLILSPTLDFVPGRGLRFAIAWDDRPPQIVDALAHNTQKDWEQTVKDGVRTVVWKGPAVKPGSHLLKIWMVDPGVVLQKLVIDCGGLKPSYLGPPESLRAP